MTAAIWPGSALPLGAHFDGAGVNFSIFSEVAERVDLCLFDEDGRETALTLPERTAFCWHGYVPGLRPGQRYGFRVLGPWRPDEGLRCNPTKLLLDPYARAIIGDVMHRAGDLRACHCAGRLGHQRAEHRRQRAVRAAVGGRRPQREMAAPGLRRRGIRSTAA